MSAVPASGPRATIPWSDVVETHCGVVFFAGDRAAKLKKPVDFGFVDFTTREARQAACRAEVELNRRFSPDVYLGVADLRPLDPQRDDTITYSAGRERC
ncbi:hypothetical protein [Yinghuangia seranimata]|uniref:hypothetical protein n=1 Tax=Yinghuangia seranimata TaxID=408067 RepID=UPI00248ADC0F|nr:hypothetical protein [Yinghuangia seranimata]MDI2130508.1 hypothetical protein [Yinghuangia seranimata]